MDWRFGDDEGLWEWGWSWSAGSGDRRRGEISWWERRGGVMGAGCVLMEGVEC